MSYLGNGNEIYDYKVFRGFVLMMYIFGVLYIVKSMFGNDLQTLIIGIIFGIFFILVGYHTTLTCNEEIDKYFEYEKIIGMKKIKWF